MDLIIYSNFIYLYLFCLIFDWVNELISLLGTLDLLQTGNILGDVWPGGNAPGGDEDVDKDDEAHDDGDGEVVLVTLPEVVFPRN